MYFPNPWQIQMQLTANGPQLLSQVNLSVVKQVFLGCYQDTLKCMEPMLNEAHYNEDVMH